MKILKEITASILILNVWTVFHPNASLSFLPKISRPLAKEKKYYHPFTRDGKTRAQTWKEDFWVWCGPCSLPVAVPACGHSLLCQMAASEGFHPICRNSLGVPPITIILLNKTITESEAEHYAADSPHHWISVLLGSSLPLFGLRQLALSQTELMHMYNRLSPVDCVAKAGTVLSVSQHYPITDSDRTSNMPWVPPLRVYSTHPQVHATTLPCWAAIRLYLDSKVSQDMSDR